MGFLVGIFRNLANFKNWLISYFKVLKYKLNKHPMHETPLSIFHSDFLLWRHTNMPIPTIGASIPTNAGLIPAMIPKKPIIPPTITTINNVSVRYSHAPFI